REHGAEPAWERRRRAPARPGALPRRGTRAAPVPGGPVPGPAVAGRAELRLVLHQVHQPVGAGGVAAFRAVAPRLAAAGLAGAAARSGRVDQGVPAAQPLAAQVHDHLVVPPLHGRIRARVPDPDPTAAVLVLRDLAGERGVLQRVVLG